MPTAIALTAFLVYFFSLPPTITGEDAGELITAAYSLGIPHPPGYPLWCILAHPFTWLPWGTIAWRVHLSSAVFAALTVGVVAVWLQHLTRNRLAAVAGALALAFSREFWEQAIIAEVYALNALLLALCLLLLCFWMERREIRSLWAFAALYGLSLGNHNTMLLLGPLFALCVFWVDGKPWQRWRLYLGLAATALLLTLAVYAYLPLRSLANPAIDWGNPETLSTWLRHVRRDQYAFMMTEMPHTLTRFTMQMRHIGEMWLWEFTPWIALLSLCGFVGLYKKYRYYTLFLLLIALSVLVGFALIQNFNNDREWLHIMSVFGIPAYMVTAVGIAWAIHSAYTRWGKKAALPLAILAVLSPLYWHQEHNYRSHDYFTEDYLHNILGGMAPDAIFLPNMDHSGFGTLYLQAVEGYRKDITLGLIYGYLEHDLIKDMPKEKLAEYGPYPPRRHDPEIFAWILQHTDRPVYVDTDMKLENVRCAPAGMIYRLLREGETDDWDYWAGYRWHTLDFEDTRGDYTDDLILGQYYFAKARDAFANDDKDTAGLNLENALTATGRDALFLNWAGTLAARGKAYDQAARYFDAAFALRPDDADIKAKHDRIHEKLKH